MALSRRRGRPRDYGPARATWAVYFDLDDAHDRAGDCAQDGQRQDAPAPPKYAENLAK
jgi:hypothetical protein